MNEPKSSGQIGSGPDDNFKNVKQSRDKSPAKPNVLVIVVIVIGIALAAAKVIAALVDNTDDSDQSCQYVSEAGTVDSRTNILSDFGEVVMQGKLGAVPFVMTIDFSDGEGHRNYPANPGIVHEVEVDSVEDLSGGEYRLILTDKIEKRIKVGTFVGVFDGHSYQGIYRMTDGRTRPFSITE